MEKNLMVPAENEILIVELDDRLEFSRINPLPLDGDQAGCQNGCNCNCGG